MTATVKERDFTDVILAQTEYTALSGEDQKRYRDMKEAEDSKREIERRKVITIDDVIKSFKKLNPHMTEMPDPTKYTSFAESLIECNISRWHLQVATMEIIRSRPKLVAPCDYFMAINRVKCRLRESGKDIWHENALDF